MKIQRLSKKEYPKLTEGEEYIKNYLEEKQIKFWHVRIYDLKGDDKQFREPDFYLPRLKTVVEFNGMWNLNEEQKARYREKMKVYKSNGITSVILYPENLGTIDFTFNYRLKGELKGKSKRYLLYKGFRFLNEGEIADAVIGYLLISSFILMILIDSDEDNTVVAGVIVLVALGVMAAGLGKIRHAVFNFLIHER